MKTIIKLSAIAIFFTIFSCSKSNDEPTPPPPKYKVTTLAGTPTVIGDVDGVAANAKFNYPNALIIEGDGTIYVSDSDNHKIKKITTAGVVSTIIGSTKGDVDAIGTNAKLRHPSGLVFNQAGLLGISHLNNIKYVTPLNETYNFVGNVNSGDVNATGANSKFNSPKGMCYDSQGNLYVADSDNGKIKKVTTGGITSTLVSFPNNKPLYLCIDSQNNLYATTYNNQIFKINTINSTSSVFAGSGFYGDVDGNGSAAKIGDGGGICIDPQNTIYFCDAGNQKIKKITPNGDVTTISGSTLGYADGTVNAKYSRPLGIYYFNNKLYVADANNHCIRVISNL